MKLWEPSEEQIQKANLTRFMEQYFSESFDDYHEFYAWSVREPERFWAAVWDFCGIIASRSYSSILCDAHKMPGARWFPDSHLNFAENLLRFRDDHTAIVFWGEDKVQRRLTYSELYHATASMAAHLKDVGVTKGDRIAGFLPNFPETVIAMLAVASIGAVWSSCSPDFGSEGIIDRFGQIEPKILIVADGYFHKGRIFDSLSRVKDILAAIPAIQEVIVAKYVQPDLSYDMVPRFSRPTSLYTDIIESNREVTLDFEPLAFDHPLYIMYSSGTTGKPKCIVHSVGGTLIEHLKELVLHTDLKRDDNIFYATTCGWMMWNWLVSSLATGATVVLYDGAPVVRDMRILFDMADEERVSVFGTSAGFLSAVRKAGLRPAETHRLDSLRTILSTGSPLVPESFDFVYEHIKREVCLSSISGGTDIIGCFALGCPLLPVHRGQLQTRSLGYAVQVFDDRGRKLTDEKGELVCVAPFPSMPIGFWNDPQDVKYQSAYFDRYENVWHHGDYVRLTEQQGMVFYGRSDAVLNPGGVRIGTAEIYRQLESIDTVESSVVIGQKWHGDTRIVLFVKLSSGKELDDPMRDEIKTRIREGATPRHVPAKILQVDDIPVTRSGKISELAVRNVVNGVSLKNVEALENPESLECFCDLAEMKE